MNYRYSRRFGFFASLSSHCVGVCNAKKGVGYRYGFNSWEKEKGLGDDRYTTLFRQIDTRIGRWWALDPEMKKFPNLSPYVMMNGNPVMFSDPLGDIVEYGSNKAQSNVERYSSRRIMRTTQLGRWWSKLWGGDGTKENKHYDKNFARIIERLECADELYVFSMQHADNDEFGHFKMLAENVFSIDFGQNINTESAKQLGETIRSNLYEEVFHASQFLDGKFNFDYVDGKWLINGADQYDEFEAHLFSLKYTNSYFIHNEHKTISQFDYSEHQMFQTEITLSATVQTGYGKLKELKGGPLAFRYFVNGGKPVLFAPSAIYNGIKYTGGGQKYHYKGMYRNLPNKVGYSRHSKRTFNSKTAGYARP